MDYEKQCNREAFTILDVVQRNDIASGPISSNNSNTFGTISVIMGA
jgi:hypothetical protein